MCGTLHSSSFRLNAENDADFVWFTAETHFNNHTKFILFLS